MILAFVFAACVTSHSEPGIPSGLGEVPGEDGAPDAARPEGVDPDVSFWIRRQPDDVDLLFMIDNSNSMREEQAALVAAYPALVRSLEDVGTLHVGVISSDMGTESFPVTTCDNADEGDDGALLHAALESSEGCEVEYPTFLTEDPPSPEAGFEDDFRCVATIGTGGCGFERQLEAVERALTVHALPGGENDGFLRDEALLAVVLMTNEDDCAVADSQIFGDDDSLGPLGMRCFNNPDLQTPVADLVESVRRVKAQADRMVFAGIVGVPPDLASESPDFAAVLADERMQLTVDYSPEGGGNRLVPTCDVDGLGIAFAPRRIVEWLGGLDAAGSEAIVQSICQPDLAGPAGAVARAIERKLLLPDCTSATVSSADRPLRCALYETRWDRSACGGAAIDRGIVGDARVCQVCQRAEGETDAFGFDVSACPGDAGWRYVADAPECRAGGLVELTPGSEPAPTSSVYLECRWPA